MKGIFTFIFFPVFVACIFSCGEEKKEAPNNQNSFSTSIDSLGKFINLKTYPAVSTIWKYRTLGTHSSNRITVPGPTDYVLEALLQFDQKVADKLKDESRDSIGTALTPIEKCLFEWLPKDVIIIGKTDSAQVYKATPFVAYPSLQGSYVFISPSSILLTMQTQ